MLELHNIFKVNFVKLRKEEILGIHVQLCTVHLALYSVVHIAKTLVQW